MMKKCPAQKTYAIILPSSRIFMQPRPLLKNSNGPEKKPMKSELIIITAISTTAAITFLSRWMALQAIAKVRNAFLRVLIGNFRLVVAGVTGPCPQRGLVTIRTGIPSATVIHREGVRAVVRSGPPRSGGVALRASLPGKHAQMIVRFSMARSTSSRSTLKDIIRMASCAYHLHMGAVQRELGQTVIKSDILPIGDGVTGFACRPILALVCVILLVAGIAIFWRAFKEPVNMTLFAGSSIMPTLKLEICQVVIKFGWSPTLRPMAGPALLTKSPGMGVIFHMAGFTCRRKPLQIRQPARILMARGTDSLCVFTRQCKTGLAVIKLAEAVLPVVTVQTLHTKIKKVCRRILRIHFPVAIRTDSWVQLGVPLLMAILTDKSQSWQPRLMRSQGKTGHFVRKSCQLHHRQLAVRAHMFRVAVLAAEIPLIRQCTVKGAAVSQFRLDFRMTIQAIISHMLCRPKWGVTIPAGRIQISMRGMQRTRAEY
nr:hypothetical protein [Levilinea saccharolytica]